MSDIVTFVWAVLHQWGALVTGSVSFFYGLYERYKSANAPGWKPWKSLWIFSGLCLLFACYGAWEEQRTELIKEQGKSNADFIVANRPYLNPELSIDSIRSNIIYFHVSIENSGKLPAERIRQKVISNTLTISEGMSHNNIIAPGTKMNAFYNPYGAIKDEKAFRISLVLSYESVIHETNYIFRSYHEFVIPKEMIKEGQFNYETARSSLTDTEISSFGASSEAFDRPAGLSGFEFTLPAGSPPFFISNSVRSLRIDAVNKEAVFKSMPVEGKEIILIRPIKDTPNGVHRLNMLWTTKSAELDVDGDIVFDPNRISGPSDK